MIWTYILEILGIFAAVVLMAYIVRRFAEANPPQDGSMHWIYSFFCWCSGASLEVLRRFPILYNQYFGIGSMVLMTAIFAFVSASYAVSSVFKDSVWGAYSFGVAWAAFIFFLDRYFVSSMRKTDSKREEFLLALPRLVLAIFIGIVISHPLELRLFKEELQDELSDKREKAILREDTIYSAKIAAEKEKLGEAANRSYSTDGSDVTRLDGLIQNERKELELKAKPLRDTIQCECNGICGTMRKGNGPACGALQKELDRLVRESDKQVEKWEGEKRDAKKSVAKSKERSDSLQIIEVNAINRRIFELDSLRSKRKKQKESEFSTSILSQTRALSELTSQPGVAAMRWLLMFLFILLEIAPISVKLMSPANAYDEEIRTMEQRYSSDALRDRHLIREELKLNRDLINRTAAAQRDVMRQALRRWHEQELRNQEDSEDEDS